MAQGQYGLINGRQVPIYGTKKPHVPLSPRRMWKLTGRICLIILILYLFSLAALLPFWVALFTFFPLSIIFGVLFPLILIGLILYSNILLRIGINDFPPLPAKCPECRTYNFYHTKDEMLGYRVDERNICTGWVPSYKTDRGYTSWGDPIPYPSMECISWKTEITKTPVYRKVHECLKCGYVERSKPGDRIDEPNPEEGTPESEAKKNMEWESHNLGYI